MNKLHYTLLALAIVVISAAGILAAPHLYGGIASVFPQGIQIGPMTISPDGTITQASASEITVESGNATLTNLTATRAIVTDGSGIQNIADSNLPSTITRDSELSLPPDEYLLFGSNLNNESIVNNTFILDSSINANHLTAKTIANFNLQGNKGSTQLYFNGANSTDYRLMSTPLDYNYSNTGLTLCALVTPLGNVYIDSTILIVRPLSGPPYTSLTIRKNKGVNGGYRLSAYNYTNHQKYIDSNSGATYGKTDYVCGLWNKSHLQLYVNGVLQNSVTTIESLVVKPNTIMYVGAASTGVGASTFNGTIDDISVWKKPLNETEIDSLIVSGFNPEKYSYRGKGTNMYFSSNSTCWELRGTTALLTVC